MLPPASWPTPVSTGTTGKRHDAVLSARHGERKHGDVGTSDYRAGVTWRTDKPCDEHRGPLGLLKTKGPASASPFSPLLDAGVDFYFLAFFAFFFFTIVSSFCSDIGKIGGLFRADKRA